MDRFRKPSRYCINMVIADSKGRKFPPGFVQFLDRGETLAREEEKKESACYGEKS